MTTESRWETDRTRFIDDADNAQREAREPLRDHGARLGPLALQFATLTYALLDANTVAEVLEQIVETAQRVLPGADLVSVTLRDAGGSLSTPVANDAVAAQLDELQNTYGEGPCWDVALDPGPAVSTSTDLAVEPGWPRFGRAAAALGVRSVLSVALMPAPGATGLSGALNIYSHHPDGLRDADQHIALLLATHASLALASARTAELAELKQTHMQRALDSRDVIGKAKGILMARQGISAAGAFDILRRTSQDLNTKLVKIAETLVARHQDLDDT